MNLAEDKKTPLRTKDLRLKRDMVVQWLNKTTIVRVWLYGYKFISSVGVFDFHTVNNQHNNTGTKMKNE